MMEPFGSVLVKTNKGRGSSLDDGGLDEICTENRGWDF